MTESYEIEGSWEKWELDDLNADLSDVQTVLEAVGMELIESYSNEYEGYYAVSYKQGDDDD